MPVISLSITVSPVEIVSGIPVSVTLSTNIPATIFYTLDGSTPTLTSLIAVGAIDLPTNINTVFATNGVDTSSVLSESYGPTVTPGITGRYNISNITPTNNIVDQFPFGAPGVIIPAKYTNELAAVVMDQLPDGDGYYNGYDANANPTGETDKPLVEFKIVYSETDAQGRQGKGIGTFPSQTIVEADPINTSGRVEYSEANGPLFNPRALVIFQDMTKEPYDPSAQMINRPYFSLQDGKSDRVRDGVLLFSTGLDGLSTTGSFLRAYHNPQEGTYTYYYYDNAEGRWIISKTNYQIKADSKNNLANMVFGRGSGSRNVFEWIPFQRRVLF